VAAVSVSWIWASCPQVINDGVYLRMTSKPKYVVKMEVTVTVESPDEREFNEETVKSCAMSGVTKCYERHVGQDHAVINSSPWAKCYAEVADSDCEIIEGGPSGSNNQD